MSFANAQEDITICHSERSEESNLHPTIILSFFIELDNVDTYSANPK